MDSIGWRCAPRGSRRTAACVSRPELLEDRLVLNHAPIAADSARLVQVSADPAGGAYIAPPAVHSADDQGSIDQRTAAAPQGQPAWGSDQSLPVVASGRGESFGLPANFNSAFIGIIGLDPSRMLTARATLDSAVIVHPAGIGDPDAENSALAIGFLADEPSAQTNAAQVVVASAMPTAPSAPAMVPSNSAPLALSATLLQKSINSEAVDAEPSSAPSDQLLKGHDQSAVPTDRARPAPQANAGRRAADGPPPSTGQVEGATVGLLGFRNPLSFGFASNFEAVDRALEAALAEIESLGGGLAVWLDESDTGTWAAAGAAALLAGGSYYYRQRRRVAEQAGNPQREAFNWLFTHLYIPPGQP
jgi:hypothetical protein